MSFLDLPDDVITCLNSWLPLNSIGLLGRVDKRCNSVMKEFLRNNLPWRISLEYHRRDGETIIHGAWAKLGWSVPEGEEICDYCSKQEWTNKGGKALLHNSLIKTTVWSGVGGPIAQQLKGEYSVKIGFELREGRYYPESVLPYESKRKRTEVADVERGSKISMKSSEDYDCHRKKLRAIRDDGKGGEYHCYSGVNYGHAMLL